MNTPDRDQNPSNPECFQNSFVTWLYVPDPTWVKAFCGHSRPDTRLNSYIKCTLHGTEAWVERNSYKYSLWTMHSAVQPRPEPMLVINGWCNLKPLTMFLNGDGEIKPEFRAFHLSEEKTLLKIYWHMWKSCFLFLRWYVMWVAKLWNNESKIRE